MLLSVILYQPAMLLAQGTGFTYQGRLNDGAGLATGIYDLRFTIYDAASSGSVVSGPVTSSATPVTNGLFTVLLDFGPGVFTGSSNWLQIAVRTNGAGSFTLLIPRQQLTPVPNAIYAETASAAGLYGTISGSSLSGTYSNAVTLDNGGNTIDGSFYGQFFGATFVGGNFVGNFIGTGSGINDVWHTGGNLGTTPAANFVGTTDNQPVEVRVNNQRVLRLEPAVDGTGFLPNVIGGKDNYVVPGTTGGFIGGGGGNGLSNTIASTEGVIAGGYLNHIEAGNAHASAIGGGFDNDIGFGSPRAVIAGGHANRIGTNAPGGVVSGGEVNNVANNAGWAAIGGGYQNTISNINGFIGGGWFNLIASNGNYAAVGGGFLNQNNSAYGVIGGGSGNVTGSGNYMTIGGGQLNTADGSWYSTVGGGEGNANSSFGGTIGGGQNNTNTSSSYGTIGGGLRNLVSGFTATIPGGLSNSASGAYSLAAGDQANAIHNGTFVWADSSGGAFSSTADNQFLVRASGGVFFNNGSAGVNVDQFNLNNGDINYGLKFGTGSGEAIASKRTAGGNQYGLDFYTQFSPRMSIAQNGNVGIGTTNPTAALHVVGTGPANAALRVTNGAIAISGAGVGTGTAAFIHVANNTNTTGYLTTISNPVCDGDPNALLFVTHQYSPLGVSGNFETHPYSVYYDGSRWQIYNDDFASITNMSFNVLVIKN